MPHEFSPEEWDTLLTAVFIARNTMLQEIRDIEGVASPSAEAKRLYLSQLTALCNHIRADRGVVRI